MASWELCYKQEPKGVDSVTNMRKQTILTNYTGSSKHAQNGGKASLAFGSGNCQLNVPYTTLFYLTKLLN